MRKWRRYDALLRCEVWIPIRGAGGDSGPPPPSAAQNAATEAQTAIMQQQLTLARQQAAYSNAITPLELSQGGWGVTPQTDKNAPVAAGSYVVPIGGKNYIVSQNPDIKNLQDLNTQVATAGAKRSLQALSGNLPVDPGVEQDLTRGRTQLQEELLKRLGPGYETSDPGIRAMNEFDRQSNSIRFQVRYGELSNAGALSLNSQAGLQREQSQLMGTLTGAQQPFQVSSQMLGNAAQTGSSIVGQQQAQNFGAFNLGLQQSSIGAGMIGSGIQGAATLGGAGIGAFML